MLKLNATKKYIIRYGGGNNAHSPTDTTWVIPSAWSMYTFDAWFLVTSIKFSHSAEQFLEEYRMTHRFPRYKNGNTRLGKLPSNLGSLNQLWWSPPKKLGNQGLVFARGRFAPV
jgi:hypothetical protein